MNRWKSLLIWAWMRASRTNRYGARRYCQMALVRPCEWPYSLREENAEIAKAAGADTVGFEELAESMQKGDINFDAVIATLDAMPIVGKLGRLLGPRGLMPNPKVGTVTDDVKQAVENAKGGQVRYRTDKNGIIHCVIGKVSFEVEALLENLNFLLSDLKKARPASFKGVYLRKISLSTTMGPGILLDQTGLLD